ncbi:MAG: thioredoxin family protein [Deltaproteobacteria bacterium]|nr:thioredoxin family protein [Deltaproteobacteria bacterium]
MKEKVFIVLVLVFFIGFLSITPSQAEPTAKPKLPVLMEFGRGICIPCRQMKPILESLARESEGQLVVQVVEIDSKPELTRRYRIMVIPTQVFVDANGQEVYRHLGFYPKDDLVAKLKELKFIK